MQELCLVYLQNSLQLSVIILLLLLGSPLLAQRYSAKCRYAAWAVVFVALLLPLRWSIKLALPAFLQAGVLQNTKSAASAAGPAAGGWVYVVTIIWAAGAAAFLFWHMVSHLRFLAAVKRWIEDVNDAELLKTFNHNKARLGVKKGVPVKFCTCIKTPMAVGLFRPVVLLPQGDFSQGELRLILKHELVHIRRKDIWYKILVLLGLALHWFNPAVHFAANEVLNLCEISCDEEVLRGLGTKARAQYGESIIGTIRNRNAYKTALSTNFYSGVTGMKKRVYAMMDLGKKRFSPLLLLVVLAITMCGTTAFALTPAPATTIQSGEQQQNQNMVADTVKISSDAASTANPVAAQQADTKAQNAAGNSLPPNQLVPTGEEVPAEPAGQQAQNAQLYPQLVENN